MILFWDRAFCVAGEEEEDGLLLEVHATELVWVLVEQLMRVLIELELMFD